MKYNNQRLTDLVMVSKIERNITPKISLSSIENKRGARFKNKKYGTKLIAVKVMVIENVLRTIDTLNAIFSAEQGILVFDDQPDRYYVATLMDGSVPTSSVRNSEFTLTFIVFDGVAHSINEKAATRANNILTFVNNGTAECYPVFEFQARSDLTMFGLTHPNKRVIQYGYEDNVVRIKSGQQVKIYAADCSVYVAGVKVYPTPMSQSFAIQPGTTEIAYMFNQAGTFAPVSTTYREAYL